MEGSVARGARATPRGGDQTGQLWPMNRQPGLTWQLVTQDASKVQVALVKGPQASVAQWVPLGQPPGQRKETTLPPRQM